MQFTMIVILKFASSFFYSLSTSLLLESQISLPDSKEEDHGVTIANSNIQSCSTALLDGQSLHLVLEGTDLAHQVGSLVAGNGSGDHSTGDTAGTAEGNLGGDVDL